MRQKNQIELNLGTGARVKPRVPPPKRPKRTRRKPVSNARRSRWPSMEAVVERENLKKALAQVKRNKGAAGIDGMSVDDLAGLPEGALAHDPGSTA